MEEAVWGLRIVSVGEFWYGIGIKVKEDPEIDKW